VLPASLQSGALPSDGLQGMVPPATRTIRRRGPYLSRRIGQNGSVFQHTNPWSPATPTYGRYWIDVPGCSQRKRRTVALGQCNSRSDAKRKLREHIEREGVNSPQAFITNTALATLFDVQARRWIAALATRRRKPVKPATVAAWKHSLEKWVLPHLGNKLLSDVGNGALREFVETLSAVGLSAKTIVNHAQVVKLVLASAVDADGEQLYPRKWNHDFIGLPIIKKETQYRPTVSATEIGEVLAKVKERYAVLFALLAGTGLRIGEALALKASSFSPDCHVLHVRKSIWRGQEQEPKTPNAVRVVDLAEPLAQMMREYVAGKTGYLFGTSSGRPIIQRNVLRVLHSTGKKIGLHAFRRFRTETLRRARVPEDLTKLWLGHSKETVTDLYAGGLQNDLAWRSEWCERAGLGFTLGGPHGLQNVVPIDARNTA
jgi:integrase